MTAKKGVSKMFKRLTLALGVVAFVTASTAGMANAQDKCRAGKQKTAGKTGGAELKCNSKADTKGLTSADIATCSTKPDASLVSGYSKTDTKSGPCAGTAGDAQTAIDNCETAVNTAAGNAGATRTASKCDGKVVGAMGKKLSGLLSCDSKESSKGVDQSACRSKVSGKFTTSIGKLASATDCSAGVPSAATLEPIIDTCRTNINNAIPAGGTTTTTVGGATTTTLGGGCAPIVIGQPIPNTYQLTGVAGEKRCLTSSAANRFALCTADSDCGGTAGGCLTLPWVTADGQVLQFPTGVSTTFTVAAEGAFPGCEHDLCVPCGNVTACAGVPACSLAGNPAGCIPQGVTGCCDNPGFTVPVFFVNILGGLCSRVDQYDCGIGVINTSNPQTGDNEVTKNGDTSDPGPDCTYGTADDPAPKTCSVSGAGNDYLGKIVRTTGNGSADAAGIQYRLQTPELSTTWQDGQSTPGTCAPNSTFDEVCQDGSRVNQTCTTDDTNPTTGCPGGTCPNCCLPESLISQLLLKAEPTTAGATGAFVDLNPPDTCHRAGSGFAAALPDGPISLLPSPAGPLKPQPYDGLSGSVAGAVSVVFSGPNSPIRDIGFVAITPNMPAVVVPPVCCSCNVVAGCPE